MSLEEKVFIFFELTSVETWIYTKQRELFLSVFKAQLFLVVLKSASKAIMFGSVN